MPRCAERPECFLDCCNDPGPISRYHLTKQPHGGVPGCTDPLHTPSPVGNTLEENPNRTPDCARKMRHGCVARDQEIKTLQHSSNVDKPVLASIELRPQVDHRRFVQQCCDLLAPFALLEQNEFDKRKASEGRDGRERKRPSPVHWCPRISLPHDTDA